MENIYITLSEGTKPSTGIKRKFEPSVQNNTFESIIKDMINHSGDELNQSYDSNEQELLPIIRHAYEKGIEKGTLGVLYASANSEALRKANLSDKLSDYSDFLKIDEDFMDLGTVEYGQGSILIKNEVVGGL